MKKLTLTIAFSIFISISISYAGMCQNTWAAVDDVINTEYALDVAECDPSSPDYDTCFANISTVYTVAAMANDVALVGCCILNPLNCWPT